MSETLALALELIARPSVTPDDAGCQPLIAARLARLGFRTTSLRCGAVDNLWARLGDAPPLLVLLGHTDVVPPGPRQLWHSDPFVPEVRNGLVYGRGAADMKGAVAAMTVALERYVGAARRLSGSVALLLTSDEEGPAVDGTVRVLEQLARDGIRIDWCLVGEPSSERVLGDTIKNGRRGSLNGALQVRGQQGHVAYPDKARNPIHLALPALAELAATRWDAGTAVYPPTSFQISNVSAGTGADNVIPATLEALFNFRYNTLHSEATLRAQVEATLARHALDADITWRHSGAPFLTAAGPLLDATRLAISSRLGIESTLSTAGGTSDGRFVAPTGAQVIEFGPVNATIHKVDECMAVADLDHLTDVYELVMRTLVPAD